MNDQQHPYDPYYPQPQIIGYDEYGQPVYQQPQAPQQTQGQHYDPYGGQQQSQQPQAQQGYGYDPYAQQQYTEQPQQQQPQQHQQQGSHGPQGAQYDPYGQQGYAYPSYDTGQQWAAQAEPAQASAQAPAQTPRAAPVAAPPGVPGQRPASERPAPARPADDDDDREYRTEQFSFIEEPDEDSEDVIDWLKFTESRSERREEARRRGRNRIIALVVVLVLAVAGGVGYLWSAGMLPGSSDEVGRGLPRPVRRSATRSSSTSTTPRAAAPPRSSS